MQFSKSNAENKLQRDLHRAFNLPYAELVEKVSGLGGHRRLGDG
jgi:hypothetical protein